MSQGRPKESREAIKDLEPKFEEIRKTLCFGTPTALMAAIVERYPAAKLNRREFQRQVCEQGKMNSTYQQCLGEFAAFDWAGWAWKYGTCPEFVADWNKQKIGTELVEDEQFVDPDKVKTDLAMLALFVPRNAPQTRPREVHVSFTLNCPKLMDVGFECGVKAGWLDFVLGSGSTDHARDRRGFGDGTTYNNARFRVHDPDFHRPSWSVEAKDGKWIGMVGDIPADFLLARNLAPGQIVRAHFRVYIAEVGVSFVLPPGGAESKGKAKLKQRLKLLQILPDDDGKAVVSAISIKLKKKPTCENGSDHYD